MKYWYFSIFCLVLACSSTEDRAHLEAADDDLLASFEGESLQRFSTKEVDVARQAEPAKPAATRVVEKKAKEVMALSEEFKAQDIKSKKIWGLYSPRIFEGEELTFKIKFWGITIGTVILKTHENTYVAGQEVYHTSAYLRSARFYEYVYRIDDRLDSYIEKKHFLPVKYSLKQRESKQEVDDLQLFDHEKLKTYFLYKRVKAGQTKQIEKTENIPRYFHDAFSAWLFVRGLPLEKGKIYEFPVVTKAKIKMFKVQVEGYETIETFDGDVNSIRLGASTFLPGVEAKNNDDKLVFWYSNDECRRLLKIEAEIKLGSVAGELESYKAGGQ